MLHCPQPEKMGLCFLDATLNLEYTLTLETKLGLAGRQNPLKGNNNCIYIH